MAELPNRFTSVNDSTGDLQKSKPSSEAYRNNYDAIFRKSEEDKEKPQYNLTEVELIAHISNDRKRCVDNEVYLLKPTKYPPPIGVDILILTKWGKLLIGKWDKDCVQWRPLPRRAEYDLSQN